MVRFTAIALAAAALTLSGCDHAVAPAAAPTASTNVAEPLVPTEGAEGLLVDVATVKTEGFQNTGQSRNDTAPGAAPNVDKSQPCAVLAPEVASGNQVLGTGYTTFRSMSIASADHPAAGLRQSIAVYPDMQAARAVFQSMTEAFNRCQKAAPAGWGFTMENRIRLAWTVTGQPATATEFRITRNALYIVTSTGVGNDAVLASATADVIKTNIVDPA